jgi:hypothetical protein
MPTRKARCAAPGWRANPPPATVAQGERARVLELLTSPTYRDLAIPQVWARELDEGRYWCSMSTMYRVARAAGQVRERRRQATHPPRVRPELVAHGPSQVWSWDITALKGPVKGVWYRMVGRRGGRCGRGERLPRRCCGA